MIAVLRLRDVLLTTSIFSIFTFNGLCGSLVCKALSDWLRLLLTLASISAGVVGSASNTSSSSSSAGVLIGSGLPGPSSPGLFKLMGMGGALSGGLKVEGGGLTSAGSSTVCQEKAEMKCYPHYSTGNAVSDDMEVET